ncbi:MAG TPA: hypothetical protein VH913_14140 [Hyphomicrobiaceae bacterium]|jgi:hypothetical protein
MATIPDGFPPQPPEPPTAYDLAIQELLEAGRRERAEFQHRRLAARLGVDLPEPVIPRGER